MSASSLNDLEKKNVFLTLQVSVSPRGSGSTFPNKHTSFLSFYNGWNVKERAVQVLKSVTASFFEHLDQTGPECLKKAGLPRCFSLLSPPVLCPQRLLQPSTSYPSSEKDWHLTTDILMFCSLIEVLYECINYVKQISSWKWQTLKKYNLSANICYTTAFWAWFTCDVTGGQVSAESECEVNLFF